MQNGAGTLVAVGQAKAALPDAVATQTRAIGVILPPPDIRCGLEGLGLRQTAGLEPHRRCSGCGGRWRRQRWAGCRRRRGSILRTACNCKVPAVAAVHDQLFCALPPSDRMAI